MDNTISVCNKFLNVLKFNILKFNIFINWKKNYEEKLVDCFKKLNSTSDPLVVKKGEMMPCNNIYLTKQRVCLILVWSADIDKGCKSRGLGFYLGYGNVVTAKHVLENYYCHENDNIYILFPTFENILIYKAQNHHKLLNYDIAFIGLQGCLDPLQNIKVEIGRLCEHDELHFDILESGCFVTKYCKIEIPNTNMRNQMSPEEFIISKAGKNGDSGTPIFSSSGTCVGIYIGVFESIGSSNPLKYGRVLKLDNILNIS
ncbi:hypothetical protein PO909_010188 [Leuciscus waleckii]